MRSDEPERWEPDDEPEDETPHVPPMLEREVRELPPIEVRSAEEDR